MSIQLNRRSLILGGAAVSAASALGLRPAPLLAQTAPRRGGTFRLAIQDFDTADTLDPQINETRFCMHVQYQLRNCLIEVGPNGTLVPELATEWNSSDDLTRWVFKLRQGV